MHDLCVFFLFVFSKIIFNQKLFAYCCDNCDYPGPLHTSLVRFCFVHFDFTFIIFLNEALPSLQILDYFKTNCQNYMQYFLSQISAKGYFPLEEYVDFSNNAIEVYSKRYPCLPEQIPLQENDSRIEFLEGQPSCSEWQCIDASATILKNNLVKEFFDVNVSRCVPL